MDEQHAQSAIRVETDVSLDFLTKEEKDALLSRKMDIIRQRNKDRVERHKSPPSDPTFNTLSDKRRESADKNSGNAVKRDDGNSKRHHRNSGGGANLTKVKDTVKTIKKTEKEHSLGLKPPDIMTGQERCEHLEWMQERKKSDDTSLECMEPTRRPGHPPNFSHSDHVPLTVITLKSNPQSLPQPVQLAQSSKVSRPKGRGRGRERGQDSSNDEKSFRPQTWSCGEDKRQIECQKEMLVVKFKNTAGDNSVEVEYDSNNPLFPTESSRSSNSIPDQLTRNSKPKGGKHGVRTNPNHKSPRARIGSGRISNRIQDDNIQDQTDYFLDVDDLTEDDPIYQQYFNDEMSTLSRSHSYGDDEEWEDCTLSSGVTEEEREDLMNKHQPSKQLECFLNPDAPEFLPLSPDVLRTPPGNLKVLSWQEAQGHSDLVSRKLEDLSQSSFPPRLLQNNSMQKSINSSPGPAVSTRAKIHANDLDLDSMPEPDQPMSPPFLLSKEVEIPCHISAKVDTDLCCDSYSYTYSGDDETVEGSYVVDPDVNRTDKLDN